jgi:hypothetical protein
MQELARPRFQPPRAEVRAVSASRVARWGPPPQGEHVTSSCVGGGSRHPGHAPKRGLGAIGPPAPGRPDVAREVEHVPAPPSRAARSRSRQRPQTRSSIACAGEGDVLDEALQGVAPWRRPRTDVSVGRLKMAASARPR